ncbi:MAG: hypothetical protein M3Y41_12400, partial [Pseudomonadota bacterium]|nr:hypothetical protein [Pseudomonadota bacterium]
MASDAIPVGRPGETADPSPQRARVGLAPLFLGMLGGPAAWVAQLIGNYALTSPRCYPHGVAPPAGLW